MTGPDYPALGFKAGLEIHQQLDTPKLFCRCPSRLDEDDAADFCFERALHPTASELGEVDRAAVEEARKALRFEYLGSRRTSCLVEADEEPPHAMTPEALEVALETALLLQAKPVDEVHVMRKIVVDGSNTSGFQRTSLVATMGRVESAHGDVRMATFCLEEDSARRLDRVGALQRYRLDRLGIPLIEIATEPDLTGPAHAREVAEAIGMALRATGKVKRGIGTIRQDLNVSIRDGARVEIKGVQELRLIETAVEWEVRRQLHLLDVRKELLARGAKEADFLRPLADVTDLFAHSAAKAMDALHHGAVVMAAALPHLAGLLGKKGKEEIPPPRVGRELADRARVAAGVKGIFHGDELPAYGLTPEECGALVARLDLGAQDSFVLVVAPRHTAERALHAVLQRAAGLLHGVPEETRDLDPDGTSGYLRPLPGGARMYPETDVPPIRLSSERVEALRAKLPELPKERLARWKRDYPDLSDDQARQLARAHAEVFERLVRHTRMVKETARLLLSTIPELEAQGTSGIAEQDILEALRGVRDGLYAKEAVAQVLAHATKHRMTIRDAAAALGISAASEEEVKAAIDKLILEKRDLVTRQGPRAAGAIMGPIMASYRGKFPGEKLSALVQERLQAFLDAAR